MILYKYLCVYIKTMQCFIDCREVKLIEKLKEHENFVFEQKQLELGDIVIENGIKSLLIERKTWSDLKSSLKDGRFREQRSRMMTQLEGKSTKICYLIEGIYDDSYEVEKKVLFRLQFAYNIPVIYSKSIINTIEIIDTWIKLESLDSYFIQRDIEIDQVESRLKNKIKKNYDDSSLFFQESLSSIKGITSNIAKEISNEFKTICKFCQDFRDNVENWDSRMNNIIYVTKNNNPKKIKLSLIEKIKINFDLKKSTL